MLVTQSHSRTSDMAPCHIRYTLGFLGLSAIPSPRALMILAFVSGLVRVSYAQPFREQERVKALGCGCVEQVEISVKIMLSIIAYHDAFWN